MKTNRKKKTEGMVCCKDFENININIKTLKQVPKLKYLRSIIKDGKNK